MVKDECGEQPLAVEVATLKLRLEALERIVEKLQQAAVAEDDLEALHNSIIDCHDMWQP